MIDRFQATAALEYKTGTATVDVTDGRLTVDAIGGNNTKMNWLTIVSAGPLAPDTTAPAAPTGLLGTRRQHRRDAVLGRARATPTSSATTSTARPRPTVDVGTATKINTSLVAGTSFADSRSDQRHHLPLRGHRRRLQRQRVRSPRRRPP